MPLIHPEDLVGCTLGVTKENGQVDKITIVEAIDKHNACTKGSPANIQFRCSVNDSTHEDVMSYNDIMQFLEQEENNDTMWKFKGIKSHQGPFNQNHPDYKGSLYNLTIEWENGEITTKPLGIIAADNPVSCALYAKENNLLDLPG